MAAIVIMFAGTAVGALLLLVHLAIPIIVSVNVVIKMALRWR